MTLWNNIKRYSIYRKLLASYLLLMLLSILLVTAFLYQRFSYQAEAESNKAARTALDHLDQAARSVRDRAISVGSELLHDPNMITAMLSDTTSPLLDNEVVIKLRNIQAVYPFIEYISVYNGNTGRYLNHRGITKAMDGELVGRIESGGAGASIDFVPRRLDLSPLGLPGDPVPVLSYILYSNFSNLIPKSGAIVIHVNEEKAIGELTRSLAATAGSPWMILDKQGMVISHSDPSQFLNNLSGEPFVQTILASAATQGHFKMAANGGKQSVHFARSADTGWILIGMRPYRQMIPGMDDRQTVIWGAALLLTIGGILLAFRLASRMYRPYSASQHQQRLLEASWRRAYPLLQETYLRRLLAGQNSAGKAEERLLDWRAGDEGRYGVAVARIDDCRQFQARDGKEQELIRFAIRNIADELLAPGGHCRTIETENDPLIIVAMFAEQKPAEHFLLSLIELQQTVRQYFRISLTFGISDAVTSEEAIKDAYLAAHEHLKYRWFLGHGSLIVRDAIASRIERAGDYPAKLEDSLIEAVKLGRRKEADAGIDRFVAAIRPLDYKYAYLYANQLVISVHKQFVNILSAEEGDYEAHGALLYSFSEHETLDDVGAALKPLCATVIDRIEQKRGNRNLETVAAVLQLIRSNYREPSLSLEWAAERVHYSSGHLSKLFKQATRQSFNDYVNAVRLEEAVRLLRHTDESAAAISEKVGLGSTYFFTLFKKTYGMTPAQYRLVPPVQEGGADSPTGDRGSAAES